MATNPFMGFRESNPWLGNLLTGAGYALTGLAGNTPASWAYAQNGIVNNTQRQFENRRQTAQDQQNQMLFDQQQQDRATAEAQQAAHQAALQKLLAGGGFNPQQQAALPVMGENSQDTVLQQQLFPQSAPDKWQIQSVREGNQDITYRINPQTGEKERLGAGPAFAPQQAPAQPQDIQEYQYSVSQGYKGTFDQWKAENGKRDSGLGMVGYWGTDSEGKPVLIQLSSTGQAQQTQMPNGITPVKPLTGIDTATGTAMVSPISGQTQNVIPKDLAGAAVAKTTGEGQGTAQVNLPNVEANASIIKNVLDKIKASPGREKATGLSSLNPFNMVPGSDVQNFNALKEQLGGQVFLQAFNGLKGGGQITEVEGAKATNALIRLQTAQSDKEFLDALEDFGKEVDLLTDVARRKAQGNFSSQGDDPLGIR